MHKLYLLDSSIYIFRSYFSIPDTFVSTDHQAVNAVYGYTQFLLDLLLKSKAVYISAAFDASLTSCFRNDIYPPYKANRELPDANLSYQLEKCQQVTELLGVHNLSFPDYEADDIIGTLKKRLGRKRQVVVVTRDKDLGQLIGKNDLIWDYAGDRYLSPVDIAEQIGVQPSQIADYLALAGDAVDNIPGAPGIGAKTASQLLNRFGSLNNILKNPGLVLSSDLRGAKAVHRIICDAREQLLTYKQITTIYCDIEMEVTLAELKLRPAPRQRLNEFCEQMKFGRGVLNKLDRLGIG